MTPRAIARVTLAALVAIATGAFAHAFVDHAAPAVGSTVHGSPPELLIWFTQELEPAFSGVKLQDVNGTVIVAAPNAVDSKDRTLLRMALPPLAPGKYRVAWRVLSIDSHVTEGDFTFEVAR
jgi:copper resistance protein C